VQPANLIFFLSDNHNASVMGCSDHAVVETPTMDAIANRGVRFADSYCSSTLCCPSRATIASGRFPHQTGYWDNCLAYDGRVPSWGHRVRELGGHTTSIGKLHFRSTEDDNGFDEEIAPMHIIGGHGALTHLLRYNGSQPSIPGQWDLYWTDTGVGDTEYQEYDRAITRHAVDWLQNEGAHRDRPWVLLVSYVSAHPPFRVPQRFFDKYPPSAMPLPRWYSKDQRPDHPALEFLRSLRVYQSMNDAERLRTIAAGYFGLVSHLDEQIGEVMGAAESLDLLDTTRIMYTSDHGESFGNHGLFGKNHLLEPAAKVPMLIAGPGLPTGTVVHAPVASVDLYPSIVEGAGGPDTPEPGLHGRSLWQTAVGGAEPQSPTRPVFAEFHASASLNASYLWREGNEKLIYHVNDRAQFYDLATDPTEGTDLLAEDSRTVRDDTVERAGKLELRLRSFINPEAVDKQAKADQAALLEAHGGEAVVRNQPGVVFTPPPGVAPRLEPKSTP
jgi:choline-sulfatase